MKILVVGATGATGKLLVFNSGTTSHLNVARFMAELPVGNSFWQTWNGQMPVINININIKET